MITDHELFELSEAEYSRILEQEYKGKITPTQMADLKALIGYVWDAAYTEGYRNGDNDGYSLGRSLGWDDGYEAGKDID